MFEFNGKHVASLYAIVIFGLCGINFSSFHTTFKLSDFAHFAVIVVAMLMLLGFEFKNFQERLTISAYGAIMFGLCGAATSVYDQEFDTSVWLVFPIFAVIYASSAALFLGTALVCGRQLKKVADRTLKDRFAPHRRT